MQSLVDIFKEIGNMTSEDRGCNDKHGQIHTYLETYDKLFEPFRDGCNLLEIGLAVGDSLKLWNRYFKNSSIIGIDISVVFNLKSLLEDEDDNGNVFRVIEGDATNSEILQKLDKDWFNVIIDDGDHQTQSQLDTFNILKHKVVGGGLYIIEDILALDIERDRYLSLHPNCEIIDMRHVTNRFDNVLVVYSFDKKPDATHLL